MSINYTLGFDLLSYDKLDKFALLSDQNYNLGDRGDWFNHFRGGLNGLYARVLGVKIHYREIHSWTLDKAFINITGKMQMTEYHLSSIFFNMDSAIECMVFALNALGYAADLTQFLDVTNEKKLRQVSPYNILGKPPTHSNPVKGFDTYFPSLKSYWHENQDLIYIISEQHDVSKHRSAIFSGGKIRTDPPPGFFEGLGIENNGGEQIRVSPWAEIILTRQPKIPWRQRKLRDCKDVKKLEDIVEEFCTFINICGLKAVEDAKDRIKLNYYEFRK